MFRRTLFFIFDHYLSESFGKYLYIYNYLSKIGTKFLFSTNHKDIGTLYLLFAIIAGIIGTLFSVFVRLELSVPGQHFFAGDHQLYNVVITAHAFIMLFFLSYACFNGRVW